jgi:hypothetical protein
MRRVYSQKKARSSNYITTGSTAWLYPEADVVFALGTTTYKYVYDGDFITCPTMADLIGVYTDIYYRTVITQPIGNLGFTLGVGTLLEDMGKELRFRLEDGLVVIVWRLMKQLTPQSPATVILVPGNSPNETVGFVTSFCSFGSGANGGYSKGLDDVMILRI